MAVTALETRVTDLLSLRVAEAKVNGIAPTTVEAAAVFQSIAVSLMLAPRTALYFSYLAKLGLQKVLSDELAAVEALLIAIDDLANPSYRITGETTLNKARTALLQLEQLPKISSTASAFARYDAAVEEFLTKHLAKNVKKKGASDLSRTAAEASLDLVSGFGDLKDLHSSLLSRLYALHVGIDNFQTAPFNAMVGSTAVVRARRDLETVQELVSAGDPSAARDIALRLLSARSSLRVLGNPPGVFDTLLPATAVGLSPPVAPYITSNPGPFSFLADPNVTIDSSPWALFSGLTAVVISSPITFPVTIPAEHCLMVTTSTGVAAIPMAGTYASVQELVGAFNGYSGSRADAYASVLATDATRWMLMSTVATSISVASALSLVDPASTVGIRASYTLSAAPIVGFFHGQSGTDLISAANVVLVLNELFSTIAAKKDSDERIIISSKNSAYNSSFDIQAPALGLSANGVRATAGTVQLYVDDALATSSSLQPGDVLSRYNAETTSLVASTSGSTITLDSEVYCYKDGLIGTSALVIFYRALSSKLAAFLSTWDKGAYAYNLDKVDRALAPLSGSQSPAQRTVARNELWSLKNQLLALQTILKDSSLDLPTGAARAEKKIADGIIATLLERRYDAAADALLRCDLHSIIERTADSASYAGQMMEAASAFAQQDIGVTNDSQNPNANMAISAGRSRR
jgi:hypothetical protein